MVDVSSGGHLVLPCVVGAVSRAAVTAGDLSRGAERVGPYTPRHGQVRHCRMSECSEALSDADGNMPNNGGSGVWAIYANGSRVDGRVEMTPEGGVD